MLHVITSGLPEEGSEMEEGSERKQLACQSGHSGYSSASNF